MKALKSLLLVCVLAGNITYVPSARATSPFFLVTVMLGSIGYLAGKVILTKHQMNKDQEKIRQKIGTGFEKTEKLQQKIFMNLEKIDDMLDKNHAELSGRLDLISNKIDNWNVTMARMNKKN